MRFSRLWKKNSKTKNERRESRATGSFSHHWNNILAVTSLHSVIWPDDSGFASVSLCKWGVNSTGIMSRDPLLSLVMTGAQRKRNISSPEEKLQWLGVFSVGVLKNLKMGWRRFQDSTWLLVQLSAKLTYLQFQASKFGCQCLEREHFVCFHCHINIYKMNIDIEIICDSSTSYRQK